MTTTDPFTDAARAYARESYPSGTDLDLDRRMVVDEFAAWARTHLAAQEPTEGEIHAFAAAWEDICRRGMAGPGYRDAYSYALSAAYAARNGVEFAALRAARRDEEKR